MPTRLPLIVRRCHTCGTERFRAGGEFRVNANHKLLDAWLLALCTGCGETTKLSLLERVTVRSVRPELLDRLHHNDPGLAAQVLQDPVVRHRNRVTLDWTGAWRLDTGQPITSHPAGDSDARLASGVSATSNTSGASDDSGFSDVSRVSDVSDSSDVSDASGASDASGVSGASDTLGGSDAFRTADASGASESEALDVEVRFLARIPLRPSRLIAEGCGLSRAEVERLIAEGRVVSAVRLTGKVSDDFTFTLKR